MGTNLDQFMTKKSIKLGLCINIKINWFKIKSETKKSDCNWKTTRNTFQKAQKMIGVGLWTIVCVFCCTGDAEVSAAHTGAAAEANTDSEESRNGATDTNREVPGQNICSKAPW